MDNNAFDARKRRAIRNLEERWEELTFENDFVFGAVLQSDLDLCRRVLETVLDMPIDHVDLVEAQRSIAAAPDAKAVRFDVYAADGSGAVYDIEMQRVNGPDLARRARYYQSMLDTEQLDKGAEYSELPDTYIIFFCTFDPFRRGLRRYTFRQTCQEDSSVKTRDGATRIFLNAFGERGEVSGELSKLLRYVGGVYHSDEGLVGDIEASVRKVLSSEELRREFVMLGLKYAADRADARREGREEGRAEGLEEGRAEGREEGRAEGREEAFARLAALRDALDEAGRSFELIPALGNADALEALFREFDIPKGKGSPE